MDAYTHLMKEGSGVLMGDVYCTSRANDDAAEVMRFQGEHLHHTNDTQRPKLHHTHVTQRRAQTTTQPGSCDSRERGHLHSTNVTQLSTCITLTRATQVPGTTRVWLSSRPCSSTRHHTDMTQLLTCPHTSSTHNYQPVHTQVLLTDAPSVGARRASL